MKFENTEVFNFEAALRGMRNPLESWNKSDSQWESHINYNHNEAYIKYNIGENDLKLAQKLIKAGEPHRKFLRQIFVSVDITAPLYWWKEFDTYKVGTVSNSCSTMHKLADTPITKECFEMDDFQNMDTNGDANCHGCWDLVIFACEGLRQKYNETKDKKYWKELIRLLPESWLQTRTVTMNYENILNMVTYRQNHKLTEWSESFMNWAKSLPHSNELLFVNKKPEFNFSVKYENGVYKCKYNSGEEFESTDRKTWKQIL